RNKPDEAGAVLGIGRAQASERMPSRSSPLPLEEEEAVPLRRIPLPASRGLVAMRRRGGAGQTRVRTEEEGRMSDEPLYCPWGGYELGCGCECEHDAYETPLPLREKRYCDVCGVIPAPGMECKFYQSGGNSTGCIGRRNDDHYP